VIPLIDLTKTLKIKKTKLKNLSAKLPQQLTSYSIFVSYKFESQSKMKQTNKV